MRAEGTLRFGRKKLKWEGHHLNLRAADQQKPEYPKFSHR